MRLNLSLVNINDVNCSPIKETSWVNDENKKRLLDDQPLEEKDGFHLSVENDDLTLWNGEERVYIPMLSLAFKSKSNSSTPTQEEIQVFKSTFPSLIKKMSCLKLTDDQLVELIFPYIKKESDCIGNNDQILYIEGDLENGELTGCSVSNYFYGKLQQAKSNYGKTLLLPFFYDETNQKEHVSELVKKFILKGGEIREFIQQFK